jgi:hypothetical protein
MATIEDEARAWEHLLTLLRGLPDPVDFITERWLGDVPPITAAADARLAEFVRRAPNALEARLAEHVARSAANGELETLLGRYPLLQIRASLQQTLSALDPAAMLAVLSIARPRLNASMLNKIVSLFAGDFARRAGVATLGKLDLPPELRDTLRCMITREPLPDILPEHVHEMSAEEITVALSSYMGISTTALSERLSPGGISRTGFIAPGERIGEVIRRDARALHRLGAPRQLIAERLEEIINSPQGSNNRPYTWRIKPVIGYQQDPFHTCDVYDLTRRGGAILVVTNNRTGEALQGGDLLPLLIRRACFFEGSVRYRLSPELVVRVLELG